MQIKVKNIDMYKKLTHRCLEPENRFDENVSNWTLIFQLQYFSLKKKKTKRKHIIMCIKSLYNSNYKGFMHSLFTILEDELETSK